MNKQPKTHLPGAYACEARQVWLAFRDEPVTRKHVLVQSLVRGKPTPCDPSKHGEEAA